MGTAKDVRTAVEKDLGYDPIVDSAHITVRNVNGDVTLTGTVPSSPQYLESAAAARRVASVDNHLEVVLPERDYRDDVKLATAANNALAQNVTVPDTVEATADDGNVTLIYGTERAAAEATVAGLAGVRNVSYHIDISDVIDGARRHRRPRRTPDHWLTAAPAAVQGWSAAASTDPRAALAAALRPFPVQLADLDGSLLSLITGVSGACPLMPVRTDPGGGTVPARILAEDLGLLLVEFRGGDHSPVRPGDWRSRSYFQRGHVYPQGLVRRWPAGGRGHRTPCRLWVAAIALVMLEGEEAAAMPG